MKTLMMIPILVSMSLSMAYADDVSGNPAEAVRIQGAKALTLAKALEAAGAQAHVMVDLAQLSVSNIEVTEGFLPPQGDIATFTATQQIAGPAGTQFIRLIKLNASGDEARAVFSALEEAGVKPNQGVEMATISVKNVLCNSGMVPGGTACTITISE